MNCYNCKFFEKNIDHELVGNCTIKLPPQLQEPANNFATSTRSDNGCDLGQPKKREPQE